jgi:hypothetical protein
MRALALLLCVGLMACGSITPRSVYEGIRAQDQAQRVGSPRPEAGLPAYDQYQKERARLAPETPAIQGDRR